MPTLVLLFSCTLEWKLSATGCMLDIQTNKNKSSREEILNNLREKACNIYKEVRHIYYETIGVFFSV